MTASQPQSSQPQAAAQPQTYESATARVEEIIRRLDSGEASLSETLALVSEGKGLIELCARELAAVGDALEELHLDELVSRLEGEAGQAPQRPSRAAGPASSRAAGPASSRAAGPASSDGQTGRSAEVTDS
jgi:exodeoxyribonuclease VII small subunit